MSVSYTYEEDTHYLYTKFYGVLTDADLQGHAQAVVDDPLIKGEIKEIVDLRDVESVEATTDSISEIINIDKLHIDKLSEQKTAIVAPRELLFGLSKIYEVLYELADAPARVKVFREINEARKWLGLPVDVK